MQRSRLSFRVCEHSGQRKKPRPVILRGSQPTRASMASAAAIALLALPAGSSLLLVRRRLRSTGLATDRAQAATVVMEMAANVGLTGVAAQQD